MDSKRDDPTDAVAIEDVRDLDATQGDLKVKALIDQENQAIYLEALQRYPENESIDPDAEKRLVRKLDIRIIPILGICYFFYVCTSLISYHQCLF
jgi:hypothetical protein